MFRSSFDGTPPSSPGKDELSPRPDAASGTPSLSHALDQYQEPLPEDPDLGEPFEIAGIDAVLGLAAIGLGALLALAIGGLVAGIAAAL